MKGKRLIYHYKKTENIYFCECYLIFDCEYFFLKTKKIFILFLVASFLRKKKTCQQKLRKFLKSCLWY